MGSKFCWSIKKKKFEGERVLLWAAERYDCGDAKGTGEAFPRTTADVHTAVCFSMETDRNKTQPLRLYSFVVGSKQHEHFPLVLQLI
jgi:hypothetical protein